MTSRFCRALACAALLAIALVLLAGCGSSGSTSASSASPSATAGTPQEVSTVMTDGIVKGEFDKGSMTLVKAASVKSTQAPGFYFVAMKFGGPDGDQVGVCGPPSSWTPAA
jgi:hypothetical protein